MTALIWATFFSSSKSGIRIQWMLRNSKLIIYWIYSRPRSKNTMEVSSRFVMPSQLDKSNLIRYLIQLLKFSESGIETTKDKLTVLNYSQESFCFPIAVLKRRWNSSLIFLISMNLDSSLYMILSLFSSAASIQLRRYLV